jgi:hypothetical protein
MKTLLLMAGLALGLAIPSYATTITYSTIGTLTCTGCAGNGTSTVTTGTSPNTATINFTGIGSSSVCSAIVGNADCTTNASFGDFFSSAAGAGSTFTGGTFNMVLTQTAPPPTGGSPATFAATFSGTITPTTNGVNVSFNGANQSRTITATLGNTTYTLPSSVLLVPQTTNGGDTTLQGVVQYSATNGVPEPGSLALLGCGMIGLALIRRRRIVS